MPQQTNLNVAPYFDDFNSSNDFYRVLFKPGYPVQARELTTLQSILQNQVEKFGQHFFKEGAKIIPGNTTYNSFYYGVQINNNYQGVPVSAYVDQLIGTKITGQTSGISAVVDKVLLSEDSENDQLTLYIGYLNSNTSNNSTLTFSDGEELKCSQNITSGLLGNTVISAGAPFATTISNNAAITGSAFSIQEGIYFVRGQFCNVNTETLLLDQYSTIPSYRVGLFVNEEIINSDIDQTLNDNSQGYNNYSAPGADRLKLSLSLFKKSLDDFDDTSFVELSTINEGVIRSQKSTKGSSISRGAGSVTASGGGGASPYSENFDLTDTLARRTFDESGNYDIKPFDITVINSLDNKVGNGGLLNAGQFTPSGETASEDVMLYKVSPGKAYVKGYEIETIDPIFIDADKPRNVKSLENQAIIYNTGPTFKVNNVYRTPTIGIGSTYVLSLRDQRVGLNSETAPGSEIGLARVYDFRLESGSYENSNKNKNQWDLSLYDVTPFTNISLNQSLTQSVPAHIEGKNSGAKGFLHSAVSNGTALTVYNSTGTFLKNEQLIINGINNGRIATAITAHTISDVRSIYGTDDGTSGINTFSANIIPSTLFDVGVGTVGKDAGDQTKIQSSNPDFPGITTVGNLLQWSDLGISNDPILARVTSVSSDHVTVVGVQTVSGICNGGLPTTASGITSVSPFLNVSDLKVLSTELDSSSDNTLYTPLSQQNVSSLDLSNSSVIIRKTFTVNISGNQLETPVPTLGSDESFQPFTAKRYSLIGADGITHELTADQFDFGSGNTCQIRGLIDPIASNKGATLVVSIKKSKPKSKEKIRNRVKSITVDKSILVGSGIGTTTLNNGLTHGDYPYGTRVEDKIISLNVPDVISVHGIFESSDTSAASAPRATLSSIVTESTTTSGLIIGEELVGQTSNAVAIVAERIDDSTISFIYKNDDIFEEGETLNFKESGAIAVITTLNEVSFDISPNYSWVDGQEGTFYNYSSIERNPNSDSPAKQIKIYYMSGSYDSNDNGDIVTINSYDQFDYSTELTTIDGNSQSDIIDIRPRVNTIASVSEGDRSPLEFLGRSFTASGNSVPNILASDETILVDFSFYLGRIDRIFLDKDGNFQVKYGDSSLDPQPPVPVDDAIEIAKVTLPPYLYNVSQASLEFLNHKRFRMVDIKNLENRIKNLEYYTTLSLLETNTANMFVADADGLNRFKSGFFVDNFSSFKTQDSSNSINNSIDRENGELRPSHFTTSTDLIFGPVVGNDPTDDLNFRLIDGVNVRKKSDIITLDYSEVEWLKQSFATRTESVTPFMISFWQGTMELTPATDTWIDTRRIQAKIIETEGNFSQTINALNRAGQNVDPQTGMAPVVWNAWQTNWSGQTFTRMVGPVSETRSMTSNDNFWRGRNLVNIREFRTVRQQTRETFQTGVSTRSGTQTLVREVFNRVSQGDRVVSRDLVSFMRSRNIEFVAKKVKPLTKLYAFFDGKDVTKYCVPKLIQISMTSGAFQVGERVIGAMNKTGLQQPNSSGLVRIPSSSPSIRFRVAQSNHKEGPYNLPTKVYAENPYNYQSLSASYSSTSTVLNVDTFSLASEAQGRYFGYIQNGMILRGENSGAIATITDVKLLSDIGATCIGSLFLPVPDQFHPRFETGTKLLTLTNDSENSEDEATTIANESFTASGTIETVQENILSVRNARIERRTTSQRRTDAERTVGTEVITTSFASGRSERVIARRNPPRRRWGDPLAQSFQVEDVGGIFLTKVDLFFRTRDDMDIPVLIQIRPMTDGLPSESVVPLSEVVLDPNQVNISADGSIATTISFKAPVYLEGGNTDYCVVIASDSTKYSVYISRVGETDLLTDSYISNQPYLGSLFKSQNASTWEPSQWEDLKFTLYRAEFESTGTVELFSPELSEGNNQIAVLQPDSIELSSRKIRVGLGTTVGDSYEMGNRFDQMGTLASGNLVGAGGSAGGINITAAGIGYTPIDGNYTFSSVNLVTITGTGRGAVADIYVNNGVAAAATITSGGTGYSVGDVLGITTIGLSTGGSSGTVGRNARFSITGIGMTNELTFDNVQGEFVVGTANTLFYTNSSGIRTELNWRNSTGGDVQISSIDVESDGLHMKVNHKNHGMYSTENRVKISNAQTDIKPGKLSIALETGNQNSFSVSDGSIYENFEGVGVGTTNRGYVKIGNEIIEYNNVNGNVITISERGSDSINYSVGTPVYKYELGGVSLKRINTTHGISTSTATSPTGSISFDSYNIKLGMTGIGTINDDRSNDVGYPKLYLNSTKSAGGYEINATQNIPFEIITPLVQNITVTGTTLGAAVRTVSGSSISGSEIPFIDEGYESITLNESNYLDSTRAIYSKVNEDEKLDQLEGNKSLQMRLTLATVNSKVSPVIDGQRMSTILTNNRVNDVVSNYATDNRVKTIVDDPTAAQYVSKEIQLENGSSSIKIVLNAHVNVDADIKAFYSIGNKTGFDPIFTPFPGFDNLDSRGKMIAIQDSNGQSDSFVPKSNDNEFGNNAIFKEYTFTADQLPTFRNYRIKLLLTSKNQVYVPRVKDLRVMALA